MKKLTVAIAALLLVALPRMGLPDSVSYLTVIGTGHTTSPACASGTCDGTADATSGTIDLGKISYARGQIFCSAGPCTVTITVNMRSKRNSTAGASPAWTAVFSCANVSATTGICSSGAVGYINIPTGGELQVVQSGTAAGTSGFILETHVVTP